MTTKSFRQTHRKQIGQVLLEFTFCMAVVLIIIFSLAMILRWAGTDFARRRIAHDETLLQGGGAQDRMNDGLIPQRQLDPYFYRPARMNAVWGER